MEYILFGLYFVLALLLAAAGMVSFVLSIALTIVYFNPLWMLGVLVSAACWGGFVKVIDHLL